MKELDKLKNDLSFILNEMKELCILADKCRPKRTSLKNRGQHFFADEYKGAQNPDFLQYGTLESLNKLIGNHWDILKILREQIKNSWRYLTLILTHLRKKTEVCLREK